MEAEGCCATKVLGSHPSGASWSKLNPVLLRHWELRERPKNSEAGPTDQTHLDSGLTSYLCPPPPDGERAAAERESKAAPVPSPSSYIRDQMISAQAPEAGIKAQGGQRGTREGGGSPVPAGIYTGPGSAPRGASVLAHASNNAGGRGTRDRTARRTSPAQSANGPVALTLVLGVMEESRAQRFDP